MMRKLSAILLLATPVLCAADDAAKPAGDLGLLRQIERGFVQLFEKVAPTVVVIEAVKPDDSDSRDFQRFELFLRDRDGESSSEKEHFPLPRESRSEGSGFVIRSDGFIITNHHVVADAEKIDVRLKDRRRFPAKLVGADERTDIAVVKIDAKDLPAAELGDSDALKVGQLVCAIGAPFNQDYSFTCGWVSGKGRSNLLSGASNTVLYEDYIQTDAFINPGNSGGPLFDVEGKVVGMNTLINGIGRGLAFAIPSAMLGDISQRLIADGKVRRSWLGVRIDTLSENPVLREHLRGIQEGVVVGTLLADAPAYKSDLRPNDVITQVDGVAVRAAREFQKEIVGKKIGQTVQLTVWRAGKTLTIPIATGELPASAPRPLAKASQKPTETSVARVGMKFRNSGEHRVVISTVEPESAAAKAGVQMDDVVAEVESKPASTASEAAEAIELQLEKSEKKSVALTLERKGMKVPVVLELAK
jgi:S1-C subfamily serine protease